MLLLSIRIKIARHSKSENATVIQPRMELNSLQVLPVNTRQLPFVQLLQKLPSVSTVGNAKKVKFVIVNCRGKVITANFLSTRRTPIAFTLRVATIERTMKICW